MPQRRGIRTHALLANASSHQKTTAHVYWTLVLYLGILEASPSPCGLWAFASTKAVQPLATLGHCRFHQGARVIAQQHPWALQAPMPASLEVNNALIHSTVVSVLFTSIVL